MNEINRVKDTGLGLNAIAKIREKVVNISSNHGINPAEAIKHLEDGILKNYDSMLGLQPEVKHLRDEKARIQKEISEEKGNLEKNKSLGEKRLHELNDQYEVRRKEIEAYAGIRKKGIDDETIIKWKTILDESKLNPAIIEEELKSQANLKRLTNEGNKKIVDLEAQKKILETSIETLTLKKKEIESAISAMKDSAIRTIQSAYSTASAQVKTATDLLTLGVIDNLKIIEQTKVTLVSQTNGFLVDTDKKLSATSANVKKELDSIQTQVTNLINQATDAGKKIGSLEPIADAYLFIGLGKGEPEKVIPIVYKFLVNLKLWLKSKKRVDIILENHIDEIMRSLTI